MENTTVEDACAAEATYDESERPLHIGAVFILLLTSMVATVFPVIAKRVPSLRFPRFGILIGKHIGTGVILALGFIHLLPPAIEALTSECLPEAYHNYSYAPLIAMISALAMQLIDNTLHGYHHIHEHGPENKDPTNTSESGVELTSVKISPSSDKPEDTAAPISPSPAASNGMDAEPQSPASSDRSSAGDGSAASSPAAIVGASAAPTLSATPTIVMLTNGAHSPGNVDTKDIQRSPSNEPESPKHADHKHADTKNMMTADDWSRTVSTYLLELACTMHSVIIGVTLGVAADEFRTLLAALTFHQFFEGFALGTRICDLGLGVWNEFVLGFIYSISAPVGIAIGVGISSSYNPNSTTALLTQGFFDAISAGILFYMAFVTLMSVDFREDTKLLSSARKSVLYMCVYCGAAVMAVIGLWL